MAKYYGDGTILGAIYEKDDRFYYECEFCSYSCSGPDERKLEMKVDAHEKVCRMSGMMMPS